MAVRNMANSKLSMANEFRLNTYKLKGLLKTPVMPVICGMSSSLIKKVLNDLEQAPATLGNGAGMVKR